MKKIFTLILIVAGFGMMAIAQDNLELDYDSQPRDGDIVIDGYIDDIDDAWGADWTAMDNAGGNNSTSDMSAEFQVMNDADFIYLAAKIQDATPGTWNDNSWERDCIEVFFSMNQTHTDDGNYQRGDFQIRCQRTDDTFAEPGYIDGGAGDGVDAATAVAEVMVETSATEWSTEMKFDMMYMADGVDAFDGEQIGFDIVAADNSDTGRTQQQFWNSNSDLQWTNTTKFGDLNLATSGFVSSKDVVVEGKAFISNNALNIRNVNGVVNVYNLKGAQVMSVDVNGSTTVDVSSLNNGMYIVKGDNLTAKVVK